MHYAIKLQFLQNGNFLFIFKWQFIKTIFYYPR